MKTPKDFEPGDGAPPLFAATVIGAALAWRIRYGASGTRKTS